MTGAVQAAKLLSLGLSRRLGVNAVIARSAWRQSRLLILCYHGLSLTDEHQWEPWTYMRAEVLRARLERLRKLGARILPLSEGITRLSDGTLPPMAVAITFDDGFYDFSALATPLLQEFNAPATVYLTTWYCGRSEPVFDPMASYVMWRARSQAAIDGDRLLPGLGRLEVADQRGRNEAFSRIVAHLASSRIRGAEKAAFLRRLGTHCADNYEELVARRVLQLMTPEEVRALPRPLIDVQLHTHRHRTPEDPELFAREIADNRSSIGAIMGDGVRRDHFCYPSGVTNPAFLPWLRDAGVASATTCEPYLASQHDDRLLLPRIVDSDVIGDLEFEGWATGVRMWLRR